MTERTFDLFCFMRGDSDGVHDERRDGIPEWKLAQAVNWAVFRGFDTVLVEARNTPPSSTRLVTHHVCSDSRCPGGCSESAG